MNSYIINFSNGEWFAFIKKDIINSKNFLLFVKVLEKVIQVDLNQSKSEHMIIMDNATIHFSKLMKKAYRSLVLQLRFLPPYTPELAPVELAFRAIKGKCQKQHAETKFDFTKMKCMKIITNIIGEIKKDTWFEC